MGLRCTIIWASQSLHDASIGAGVTMNLLIKSQSLWNYVRVIMTACEGGRGPIYFLDSA